MNRIFTFIVVCVITLFSVGCSKNVSVKDVSTNNTGPVVEDVPTDNIVEELPDDQVEVPSEDEGVFDPDSYEDKEIDDLIGLLEGLVEG